jgi:hypothetical protein
MDGNMTPAEFFNNGSVQCMKGVMAAPKEGTCRHKERWSCYDYFFIDERLQELVVEVQVLKWWHSNPHKPVKLVLRADKTGLVKLVQVIPDEQWEVSNGQDVLFTSDAATDGSRIGNWRELGRTGWAGVMLCNDSVQVALALWGPLRVDLPVQRTIARAELYAVWKVLVNCVPPVRLHVDCGMVVDGVAKGRRWCTHSSRPHADVWALVWDKLEDLGLGCEGATVHKIAAHLSVQKKRAMEPAQLKLQEANEQADAWAKLGATLGENQFLAFVGQAVSDAAEKITGALDHISLLAAAVIARDGKWTDATPPPRGVGDQGAKAPRVEKPAAEHVLRDLVPGLPGCWQQCERCLRAVLGSAEREALIASPCCAHPAQRLAIDRLGMFATSNEHTLWVTGPYMWCSRCASHSMKCVRHLARRCEGRAKAKWVRTNLWAGRAPKALVTGEVIGLPARLAVAHWVLRFYAQSREGEEALAEVRRVLEEPDQLVEVMAEEGVEAAEVAGD